MFSICFNSLKAMFAIPSEALQTQTQFFSTVTRDVAWGCVTSLFHHRAVFNTLPSEWVWLQISVLNPNSLTLQPNKSVPRRLHYDVCLRLTAFIIVYLVICLCADLGNYPPGRFRQIEVMQTVEQEEEGLKGARHKLTSSWKCVG